MLVVSSLQQLPYRAAVVPRRPHADAAGPFQFPGTCRSQRLRRQSLGHGHRACAFAADSGPGPARRRLGSGRRARMPPNPGTRKYGPAPRAGRRIAARQRPSAGARAPSADRHRPNRLRSALRPPRLPTCTPAVAATTAGGGHGNGPPGIGRRGLIAPYAPGSVATPPRA